MKQHVKKQLDTLLNGPDDRQVIAITIQRPDGSKFLYGCWPPIPGLKPGDQMPETLEEGPQRLNVVADSPETVDVFLKLRGERQ